MATRGGGPGPGFRHRALRGLLLLCLWLPGSRPGEPAAPSSGVDRLLQDFRRQLQRARPREELEPELLGVSKAGKDVVLHLPTDGVVLDGRESSDDHAIVLYEWTLQQGDPSSVDMKVPQPGTLRLSRLKEGAYIFQLTVTDSVGQRSSDNVSVTVLPRPYSTGVALDRKLVTHTVATSAQPGAMGLNEGEGDPKLEKSQRATTHNQPATVSHPETRIHSTQKVPESQINPVQPDSNSSGKNQEEGNYDLISLDSI